MLWGERGWETRPRVAGELGAPHDQLSQSDAMPPFHLPLFNFSTHLNFTLARAAGHLPGRRAREKAAAFLSLTLARLMPRKPQRT